MKNTTLALQQLVFGDRNTFIFTQGKVSDSVVNRIKVAKFLIVLDRTGYAISNADILFDFGKSQFKEFEKQLLSLIEENTKEGFIFRKTFAKTEELTSYTEEDWRAIIAQYAITYGWSDKYNYHFGGSAVEVLDQYVGSMDFDTETKIDNTVSKIFSIGGTDELVNIVRNILQSKTVLRSQQLKTIKSVPKYVLSKASRYAKISIKETLVIVMELLKGEKIDFPLLKSSTDILRYIVSSYGIPKTEGKLSKDILRKVKIKIPTSVRKSLLNNLELIAKSKAIGTSEEMPKKLSLTNAINLKGSRFLCEDMFAYDKFWKVIARYLRFEKSSKSRVKFPLYSKAIDLLYEDDRSWTFNGRYSKAKEELDYDKAINIAKENPGFLLRNLIEFVRMTEGTSLPEKKDNKLSVNNAFHNKLSGTAKIESKVIKTDAINFILSDEFSRILDNRMNTKLGWQLIEQLKNKELFKEVFSRIVQGIVKDYSTPT